LYDQQFHFSLRTLSISAAAASCNRWMHIRELKRPLFDIKEMDV